MILAIDARTERTTISQVASVHVASLPHTKVGRVGAKNAERVYRIILKDPKFMVRAYVREAVVVGVLVASDTTAQMSRGTKSRLVSMLPLLLIAILPKLLSLLKSEFQRRQLTISAEPAPVHVEVLAVAGPARGEGVATKLVTYLEEELKAIGIPRISVDTETSNSVAVKFYKSQGFQVVCADRNNSLFVKSLG